MMVLVLPETQGDAKLDLRKLRSYNEFMSVSMILFPIQ